MEQDNNYPSQQTAPVITMGQWIINMLIVCIPLVGFIMLIVWATSSSENPNRSNWAKAQLIFMVIGFVLYLLLASVIGAAFGSMFS